MVALTEDMRRVVREQRLAYVATVCRDGTPNVSPKGTLMVWDDGHLVFADIRSPRTVANLRANPAIEVNVVDPLLRKGYRFKGKGAVITPNDPDFEEHVAFFRRNALQSEEHAQIDAHAQRCPFQDFDECLQHDEMAARRNARQKVHHSRSRQIRPDQV